MKVSKKKVTIGAIIVALIAAALVYLSGASASAWGPSPVPCVQKTSATGHQVPSRGCQPSFNPAVKKAARIR